MAAPRDWSDFNWFASEYIPRQTIPILKKFAAHLEIRTRLSVNLRAGDKKADIVEKVQNAFKILKTRNSIDDYWVIRQKCEQEGIAMAYRPSGYGAQNIPNPTFGGVPARTSAAGQSGYSNGGYGAGSSMAYRPPPAAGPSRNGWQTQTNTATAYSSRAPHLQDWKPNPMWKPIRALTNMEALPDIGPNESTHTRRERKLHVTLTPDIIDKLNHSKSHPQAHPQYSVRIFCASSDYFRAPNAPLTPANGLINNKAIPIEYPNNPDVYVDEYGLPFKERGLRGKAGSAPPFDLDKGPRGLPKVAGRMTSVSMGHTGPTTGKKKDVSKKFYFQVVYCEITSPTELQNRIDRMIPAGAQESLKLLRKKQDDDDDIVFGQSRMSLKDPLSYMRLTRPVRSTRCTHLQCFEAKWWISGNEKHPQWLCPLCNHELRFDELIVDGYTLEILATVPDDYDEVVIEADNAWHTEDGKYASPAWLAANPSKQLNGDTNGHSKAPTPAPEQEDRKPSEFRLSSSPDPKGKRKAIEILSSDDEEEQPLSKASSRPPPPTRTESRQSVSAPASRPPAPPPQVSGPTPVIDLTLSDSDDSEVDDPYFDRPNDRRTQGAGSTSAPPVKALEDRTSVRSPLAPSFTPSADPRSRGASDLYRPASSTSESRNMHPNGGSSDPALYSSSGTHYHSSHDRLAPLPPPPPLAPRRQAADSWRPPSRDRDRDRDREREDRYERYGGGRSTTRHHDYAYYDDNDDDEWSPYNRHSHRRSPLTSLSRPHPHPDLPRSPPKIARGRKSPIKQSARPASQASVPVPQASTATVDPSLSDLFVDNCAPATDRPSIDDLFPEERNDPPVADPRESSSRSSEPAGEGPRHDDQLSGLFQREDQSGPASSSPSTAEGASLTDLLTGDDSVRLASARQLASTLEDLFAEEDGTVTHPGTMGQGATGLAQSTRTPPPPLDSQQTSPPMPKSADDEVAIDSLL